MTIEPPPAGHVRHSGTRRVDDPDQIEAFSQFLSARHRKRAMSLLTYRMTADETMHATNMLNSLRGRIRDASPADRQALIAAVDTVILDPVIFIGEP